jgi:hypothetical protein
VNAARYSLLADIRDVDPPSSVRVPGITLELTWHTQLRATRLWRLNCCHRIGYLGLRHRWSIPLSAALRRVSAHRRAKAVDRRSC